MPYSVIRNDITKMKVDAIVNAANTDLQAGGGVCGAIFSAAGADALQRACDEFSPINTGEAVITKGFSLPAKYVIHTAGPIYRNGKHNEETLLRACYRNSLELANKHGCTSIAFPLISSGIYGYPKDKALAVATSEISKWLLDDKNNVTNEMNISLVVFDKKAFSLSKQVLGKVKAFIDENYVDESEQKYGRSQIVGSISNLFLSKRDTPSEPDLGNVPCDMAPCESIQALSSDSFTEYLDEPFSATLMRIIDAKGKSDIEVYKRANLDRKLFSKIRTGKGYMPSKKTAVALAVALELSLPETRDLLERAGFALSRSVLFDVIIEYFIANKKYDIYEINNVLFQYDQPLLGA